MKLKKTVALLCLEMENNNRLNVGLIGDLGSGKTYLVKKLLETINPLLENQISSPTYNICNIYQFENITYHHFDLYRIENEEELYDIDIWESIEESENITLIEWVDMFPEIMAKCDIIVSIEILNQNDRKYKVSKYYENK
jgi:tRNA threonylcarbamoyladenosine biosynthesis protein TsaE